MAPPPRGPARGRGRCREARAWLLEVEDDEASLLDGGEDGGDFGGRWAGELQDLDEADATLPEPPTSRRRALTAVLAGSLLTLCGWAGVPRVRSEAASLFDRELVKLWFKKCPVPDREVRALRAQQWPRPGAGEAPDITKVIYINMKWDVPRREYMERQFRELQPFWTASKKTLAWERVEGVDSEDLRGDEEYAAWRQKGFNTSPRTAADGDWRIASCAYNHYLAIQHIPNTASDGLVLIMEDDVELKGNFLQMWTKLWPFVPEQWDVLRVGWFGDTHNCSDVVNPMVDLAAWSITTSGACHYCGAQAYVVNPSSRERVLGRFERASMTHADELLSAPTPYQDDPAEVPPLRAYAVFPMLASTHFSGNGYPAFKSDRRFGPAAVAAPGDGAVTQLAVPTPPGEAGVAGAVADAVAGASLEELQHSAAEKIREIERAEGGYKADADAAVRAAAKQVRAEASALKELRKTAEAYRLRAAAAESRARAEVQELRSMNKTARAATQLANGRLRREAQELLAARKAKRAADEAVVRCSRREAEELGKMRKARDAAEAKAKKAALRTRETREELAEAERDAEEAADELRATRKAKREAERDAGEASDGLRAMRRARHAAEKRAAKAERDASEASDELRAMRRARHAAEKRAAKALSSKETQDKVAASELKVARAAKESAEEAEEAADRAKRARREAEREVARKAEFVEEIRRAAKKNSTESVELARAAQLEAEQEAAEVEQEEAARVETAEGRAEEARAEVGRLKGKLAAKEAVAKRAQDALALEKEREEGYYMTPRVPAAPTSVLPPPPPPPALGLPQVALPPPTLAPPTMAPPTPPPRLELPSVGMDVT